MGKNGKEKMMREKSLDIKKRDRCQFQEAELHHLRNRKSGCDHFIA